MLREDGNAEGAALEGIKSRVLRSREFLEIHDGRWSEFLIVRGV